MRRFRDRQSNRLFRGGELSRVVTMITMLAVLAMIIRKAGDSDTWRFLASDPALAAETPADEATEARPDSANGTADHSDSENQPASSAESPPVGKSDAAAPADNAADDSADGTPLDEDSEERGAIADEFQAITDRSPLAKEDMFAYWRLLRWTESSKLSALLKRGRTNIRYGDLILDPAAYRGELLKIRLHVVQLLKIPAAADNPLGIETYYQALGWNDSSQTWFYFCIFTDLPPGMPWGDRITQEGTFVGYFLKTISYLDGQGKGSQAPVLIGRMVWHPSPQTKAREENGLMPWLIGGLMAAGFLVRLIWSLRPRKKREPLVGLLRGRASSDEPTESVEEWLDRVDSSGADEAINEPGARESNGTPQGHAAGFPRDPRLDQSEEPGG